jgi:hypothetical protein
MKASEITIRVHAVGGERRGEGGWDGKKHTKTSEIMIRVRAVDGERRGKEDVMEKNTRGS